MTTILTLQLEPVGENHADFQFFYGKKENIIELVKFLRKYEIKVDKKSFQFSPFEKQSKPWLQLRASVNRPGLIETVIKILVDFYHKIQTCTADYEDSFTKLFEY